MRSRQTRQGFSPRTLQSLRKSPSSKWRDSDAEDTVRFTSLRLREAGMIESKSQKDLRQRHPLALLERSRSPLLISLFARQDSRKLSANRWNGVLAAIKVGGYARDKKRR